MSIKQKRLKPKIYPRSAHNISRQHISENALKVLTRLNKAGYQAFLVGGSVRDLLLEKRPKDFDVATNATPEEVKSLFRNCRLIGRRFRLAHVYFGPEIIEVATFRSDHNKAADDDALTRNGMIIRDNVYGSLEEDAWRRDFSINALYYNIADYSVVDFTGGMLDLKKQHIRMIGNPQTRYREDPVRMLRAVRFASKLELDIHKHTAAPLIKQSHLLKHISPSRLFDELLKLLLTGHAYKNFTHLRKYKLFRQLFPMTIDALENDAHATTFEHFIELALKNTDQRIHEGKRVTPAFLLAVLLWQPVQIEAIQLRKQGLKPVLAMDKAIGKILQQQSQYTSIPRRFTHSMRSIWTMQAQFFRRNGKRPLRLLEQPRFRAAYDFLLLRAEAGEKVDRVSQWWQDFVNAEAEQRQAMVDALPTHSRRKK